MAAIESGAGLGVGVTGAVVAVPALTLSVYGAAHESALRKFSRRGADDATTRMALLARLDEADESARRQEVTGMTLFFTGLGMFLGGAVMAGAGLGNVSFADGGRGSSGNAALFGCGVLLSVIGDAAWVTGWIVWSHAGGARQGLRESRRALSLTPAGVAGTF